MKKRQFFSVEESFFSACMNEKEKLGVVLSRNCERAVCGGWGGTHVSENIFSWGRVPCVCFYKRILPSSSKQNPEQWGINATHTLPLLLNFGDERGHCAHQTHFSADLRFLLSTHIISLSFFPFFLS